MCTQAGKNPEPTENRTLVVYTVYSCFLFLFLLIIYVNHQFTFNLTNLYFKKVYVGLKKLNLLRIEPWLSIRKAEALIGVPMVFTVVFYFLFLFISYVS